MGRLIKNHWARLIMMTAATCKFLFVSNHISSSILTSNSDQIVAAIEGFFWPKIFWDFLTKNLDGAVKPIPVLQVLNLVFGLLVLAMEWPLNFFAGTAIHRSIESRLVFLPITILTTILMYQTTNPAIYYTVAMGVYFWAYSEGEVRLTLALSLFLCHPLTHLPDHLRSAMDSSPENGHGQLQGLNALLPANETISFCKSKRFLTCIKHRRLLIS